MFGETMQIKNTLGHMVVRGEILVDPIPPYPQRYVPSNRKIKVKLARKLKLRFLPLPPIDTMDAG
jgi:hypothetical protein